MAMNLTSREEAVWQRPGVPASLWLPLVAHCGFSLLWWALYIRPSNSLTPTLFYLAVFAGSLAWAAIGAGRLALLIFQPQNGWPLGVIGIGYMVILGLLFARYLPEFVLPALSH